MPVQKGNGGCDPPEVTPKETGRLWHKALVGPPPGQVTCVQTICAQKLQEMQRRFTGLLRGIWKYGAKGDQKTGTFRPSKMKAKRFMH